MDVLKIPVPRVDAGRREHDVGVMHKHAATADSRSVIVLSLAHWPPGHLTTEWLAAAAGSTESIAAVSGRPPILGEVPPDTFDDLMAGRQPAVLASVEYVLDQLFRNSGGRTRRTAAAVKNALRIDAGLAIANRVKDLDLVEYGHFELPGGSHHTNVRINVGSLLSGLHGTNGLRGYITAVASREIAPVRPAWLVYPADFNDRVLPRIVRDIRINLRRLGIAAEGIRITGTYSEPRLAPEDLARLDDGGRVVLVADIAGKGARIEIAWSALERWGITPALGIVFLSRGPFAHAAKEGAFRSLAEVDGVVIARTRCDLPGRVVPIRKSVADEPQAQQHERWQPRRAVYWSAVLLGGQIGAPPEHASRHLHDLFARPSLDPDHLDALMDGIVAELLRLGVRLVVYHDTPAAEAMANRLKVRLGIPTQPITQGPGNVWSLPSEFRGHGEDVSILDDGRTRGESQIDIMYVIEDRGFHVAATVLLDDKLNERGAFPIGALENRPQARSRTLSIHRGIAAPRVTSETCLVHEIDRAIDVIVRSTSRRPAFAAEAYGALSTPILWPPAARPDGRSGDANGLLELDESCGVSEQWNQLLLHHRALGAHPRAMDTIIRDALPELRADKLGERLASLDLPWRERALLWLAPRDRLNLPRSVVGPPGCRLAFRLGALAAAETVHDFAEMFGLVVQDLESDPALGEQRYLDLVLHVLRASQSRQDPVQWLQAAVDTLGAGIAPAVRELREDLVVVVTALNARGPRRPTVLAIPSPAGVPIKNPGEEEIEGYGRSGWVLDVRPREASFTDHGPQHLVDRIDALAVGVAIVQRRPAGTRDVTGYFMAANEFPSRRVAQHRFETMRGRLASKELRAIVTVAGDRAKGEEKAIVVTDRPGMLICYDSGEPLMRELAIRLKRS